MKQSQVDKATTTQETRMYTGGKERARDKYREEGEEEKL